MSTLTDAEIDEICAGLVQNCAKVRHLQGLGLVVKRKPNGRPLVSRAHYEAVMSDSQTDLRRGRDTPLNEPNWTKRA